MNEGKEEKETPANSVFVRNLPYDTNEKEIEDFFSAIGPLRRIDLIKEKDGRLKGFGFIKFAFSQDAQKAATEANSAFFKHRRIQVEVAKPKGTKREGKKGKPKPHPAQPQPADSSSPLKEAKKSLPKEAASKTAQNQKPFKGKRGPGNASEQADEGSKNDLDAGKVLSRKEKRKLKKKQNQKSDESLTSKAPAPTEEKSRKDGTKDQEETPQMTPQKAEQAVLSKIQRPVTMIVFGVPESATEKHLFKRVKKVVSNTKVQLMKGMHFISLLSPKGAVAKVTTQNPADAALLLKKLNGHIFKGQTLLFRRQEEVTAMKGDPRTMKDCRLIIRNLSFKAKEQDLEKAFAPYGPLIEVHIPKVEVAVNRERHRHKGKDDKEQTMMRSRGFGFIQFACRRDAAKVVQDHGVMTICGRESAVDFSLAKKVFEEKAKEDVSKTEGETLKESSEGEEESSEEAECQEDEENEGGEINNSSENEGESEGSEEESESEEDEDDGTQSRKHEADPNENPKKKDSDVGEQRTVFVRNLPFDADEEALREELQTFGKVLMCLLVRDRDTGQPKGTAFVKFQNLYQAQRAIEAASEISTGRASGGVMLGGRPLQISLAVDRNQAQKMKDAGKQRKMHTDRRNLYLSNEGLIVDNSGNADSVPKRDMDKRRNAQKEKKKKLTNPLFFVSPVRLSIRNLSKMMTDKQLFQLCIKAAREGIQEGIVADTDLANQIQAQGQREETFVPVDQCKVSNKAIVSAKVVKDPDKKMKKDGPISKGYAFVEFTHHAFALAALRKLNNNPAFSQHAQGGAAVIASGKKKNEYPRLIVEFSVENHKKLKLVQARREMVQKRKEQEALIEATNGPLPDAGQKKKQKKKGKALDPPNDKGGSEGEKKLSRGQRQRLKKRLRREQEQQTSENQKEQPTIPSAKKMKKIAGEEEKLGDDIGEELRSTDDTAPSPKKNKKRKLGRKEEEEENFQNIVENYKNKLFALPKKGDLAPSCSTSNKGSRSVISSSRWFDV